MEHGLHVCMLFTAGYTRKVCPSLQQTIRRTPRLQAPPVRVSGDEGASAEVHQAKGLQMPMSCGPQVNNTCKRRLPCSSPVAVAAEGGAQVAAGQHQLQQAVHGSRHGGCELLLLRGGCSGRLGFAAAITTARCCCTAVIHLLERTKTADIRQHRSLMTNLTTM